MNCLNVCLMGYFIIVLIYEDIRVVENYFFLLRIKIVIQNVCDKN